MTFDPEALYTRSLVVDTAPLVAPFERAEILAVVAKLDCSNAPRPDGHGPSFYHASWPVVTDDLQGLFNGVHAWTVCLDGINTSFIALLPKREDMPALGDFRPISLQNCDVKIFCRDLTTRL